MNTAEYKELCDLTGGKPGKITGGGCLGVCFALDAAKQEWHFSHGICIEKPDKKYKTDFEVIPAPAASWAVFDCNLDNLQDITKRIFSEWFPPTGYEHDMAPELEVYLPGDFSGSMKAQIWMPVVKKK